MSAHGTAAEYVYAELQVVSSVGCPANDPMVGRHVVALRLNLGPEDPSRVFILSMAHAAQLHEDLGRVFLEHADLILGHENESNTEHGNDDDDDDGTSEADEPGDDEAGAD